LSAPESGWRCVFHEILRLERADGSTGNER
jgi:hypothetical protein